MSTQIASNFKRYRGFMLFKPKVVVFPEFKLKYHGSMLTTPNRRTQVKVEFTHIIRRFGVIREEYNLYPRPLDKKWKKLLAISDGSMKSISR
jgi:hypothetical protein